MPVVYSRRLFTLAALSAVALGSTGLPALAITENDARQLVDEVVAEIQKVIKSGKSDAAVLREFEKLFMRYADVNIMAQYALGNDGRSASASQKRAFADAFKGYIARKYGKQFREFIGGRIEIQSTREIRSGFEIRTKAFLSGQSPYDVTFHVSDRSGRDKFFNIYIEGVNLLLTERTEIGSMLDRRGGDIGAVVADLKKIG
ncbi:MAG: ABC transporter substrate-binding protein [Roseobacter sp.]